MTNQTQSLLDALQTNRDYYKGFVFKRCKNVQVTEDILSIVTIQILSLQGERNIDNYKSYVSRMAVNAILNFRRNDRLVSVEDMNIRMDADSDCLFDVIAFNHSADPCSYETDLFQSFQLRDIKKAALDLPKYQREAILNALSGKELGEGEISDSDGRGVSKDPRYQSLKTNKRLAIAKLQYQFSKPASWFASPQVIVKKARKKAFRVDKNKKRKKYRARLKTA